MSEIKFSRNYNDLSKTLGVDSGFQFEFACERCSDKWRSEFQPYRGGQVSGWFYRISMMFGGAFRQAGMAAEGVARAGWSVARDQAFKDAIQQSGQHFKRCGKCHGHVCTLCWNVEKGLCYNCAPSIKVEIEAARSQGEAQSAGENAMNEGIIQGKQHDVTHKFQLVCSKCNAETHGSKFCPECGHKLAEHINCPKCNEELRAGAKFCGECGHDVG
jgi:hypothetical protein